MLILFLIIIFNYLFYMNMNKVPFQNISIKKKQISLLTNSSNYLLDKNKELEDLNNPRSNTFYSDNNYKNSNQKVQIETYLNSLVKDKTSDEQIQHVSNLITSNKELNNENEENEENNDDKYNALLKKYKELEEENLNLNNTIKNNELTIEEQKGVIMLLKNSIENDFFKNNDIKNYITMDNIVDFVKLKNENEQYKKELVLSQALVISLQSENQQLIKEKENLNSIINKEENNKDVEMDSGYSQNSEMINIETEDFLSNSENKMDVNINMKESNLTSELVEENKQLKKLIEEATIKLNYLLVNEKNNKIISENNNILNIQLNDKISIIKEYEEKLEFFNSYISEIKSSFSNIQQKLINNIEIYNKMANDDLNSLLTNSFSQNLMKLSMKIGDLCQIEKYNLETKPELDVHQILYELLSVINDEFLNLYEKVFQTNTYYKESNNKINELERELKENKNKNKFINNKINDNYNVNNENEYKNEFVKTINKLNLELSFKENENYYLKEISDNFKKDLEQIINLLTIFIKIFSEKNINKNANIPNYIKNYLDNLRGKIDLMIDKNKTILKLKRNNHKIKNLKLDNKINSFNNLEYYKDYYINNVIKDFEKNIKEKENQMFLIKEKLNLLTIQKY